MRTVKHLCPRRQAVKYTVDTRFLIPIQAIFRHNGIKNGEYDMVLDGDTNTPITR